jgi:F-type H+-transporting ATPase subunit delta
VDQKVAKRYAKALYDVAARNNVVNEVESDLDSINGILKADPKFAGFLLNPRISRDEKVSILEKLFSDRVTALSMQLLRVLLKKRREAEFGAIRDEFVSLRRQYGQVLFATVTSAQELPDDQKKKIQDRLASESGKQVEAVFEVEPSLIGGVRVQYGDYILDGSVRGSLNRLRDTLRYQMLNQS